jgi:hypothetical protein
MSIASSVGKIGEAVAVWLNPERREKAILRKAIEAAEELFLIIRKQGRYKDKDADYLSKMEKHYQKQFDSWKDGAT